jgi:hypothetical protein
MKKCPPGVICIENITLFLLIISICIILFIWYTSVCKQNLSEKIIIKDTKREKENNWFGASTSNFPYNNNPYTPPLMNQRIPINIPTNIGAVDTNYRQVGILTATNSKGKIIPLMGRPIYTNRDKWQYYTISDQRNSIKLPISRNGKSCTNEYGCDRLYNGDTIYVEGLNEAYRVTIYDNDTIRYLPI